MQGGRIDPSAVQGLTYVFVADLAPTDDGGVALLLHATATDALTQAKAGVADRPSANLDNTYIVNYDKDGQLRDLNKLDLKFVPVRMASLPGSQLAVSGFDSPHDRAILAILSTDGTLIRVLDDAGSLPEADTLLSRSKIALDQVPSDARKRQAEVGALSGFLFGYAGRKTLFLEPGAKPSVWSLEGTDLRKSS